MNSPPLNQGEKTHCVHLQRPSPRSSTRTWWSIHSTMAKGTEGTAKHFHSLTHLAAIPILNNKYKPWNYTNKISWTILATSIYLWGHIRHTRIVQHFLYFIIQGFSQLFQQKWRHFSLILYLHYTLFKTPFRQFAEIKTKRAGVGIQTEFQLKNEKKKQCQVAEKKEKIYYDSGPAWWLPTVLASHMGTCSCPSCSTSDPTPCLWSGKAMAQVLGVLDSHEKPGRRCWLVVLAWPFGRELADKGSLSLCPSSYSKICLSNNR